MKQLLVFAYLILVMATTSFGQSETKSAEQEAAYTKTINQRA